MGAIDIEGKAYLSNNKIFADVFNFLIYKGRQIIQAEKLKELDTTQIVLPYGNGARFPMQKHRDLLKIWSARMDDDAVYFLLGAELQGKTHYAMPVKNGLYDMIGYAKQVEEAKHSYRKKESEGDMFIEEGALKIKLSSEEFLSGFRKADKLMPIITATVCLSADKWDGPLSLHEMLNVKDKEILKFIPNYVINLIAPANIADSEFEKFHTDFGLAMKALKYQKKGVVEVIEETNHRKIDRSTAIFLNKVANLGLEFVERDGDIDMCLAMEENNKKMKITGAIEMMEDMGTPENDIIEAIIRKYNVTKEYVLALLSPKVI